MPDRFREKVLVGRRQSGRTFRATCRCLSVAYGGGVAVYVAPTHPMAEVAWRGLPRGRVGLGNAVVTSEAAFDRDVRGLCADLIVADNADHFEDRDAFRKEALCHLFDRIGTLELIEEGEVA